MFPPLILWCLALLAGAAILYLLCVTHLQGLAIDRLTWGGDGSMPPSGGVIRSRWPEPDVRSWSARGERAKEMIKGVG